MLIGYARVSTADQELQLQLDALQAAKCERIFTDKASGATTKRGGLTQALDICREGDVLVVWKLDRLGRSVKDLIALVAKLKEKGVEFRSLTDGIDTKGAAGKFFFHIMAAMAEMERELNRERTLAGLAAARKLGRVGGRPPVMTNTKSKAAKKLLAAGSAYPEVARAISVSLPTLYRHFPADQKKEA